MNYQEFLADSRKTYEERQRTIHKLLLHLGGEDDALSFYVPPRGFEDNILGVNSKSRLIRDIKICVSPQKLKWSVDELEKFVNSLIPEGVTPRDKHDFYFFFHYMGDHAPRLDLGRLTFQETLGEHIVARKEEYLVKNPNLKTEEIKLLGLPTYSGDPNRGHPSNRVVREFIDSTNDLIEQTRILVFPGREILDACLEGKITLLEDEKTIPLESLRQYLPVQSLK